MTGAIDFGQVENIFHTGGSAPVYENTFQVQAPVPAPENIIYGSPNDNNIQRMPFIYYAESTPAFSASTSTLPKPIMHVLNNEIAFNNVPTPIMASSAAVLNVPMQSPGVVETSRDDKKLMMMFAGATAVLFVLSRLHG